MRPLRALAVLTALLSVALAVGQVHAQRGQTLLVLNVKDRGQIVIEMHTKEAPRTCAQIARLASQGFYNGQKFFKVVRQPKPFLIQTGDPGSKTKPANDPTLGTGGSGTRIPFEESGFPNEVGAVGLSTLPNDRDSGDSQFYILLGPARFLDGSYTVFGKVLAGMDVVKSVELGDQVTSATVIRG